MPAFREKNQRRNRFRAIDRLHSSHQSCVEPKDTAGILTYDAVENPHGHTFLGHGFPRVLACSALVKYSNGGCSGFEPDFLFIYSVYNFSKPYLFKIIRLYYPPGRNARKGCFCKSVNKASLRRGQRNCKDLRSETFGKYYITPRGLLQVFAQQIPVQG